MDEFVFCEKKIKNSWMIKGKIKTKVSKKTPLKRAVFAFVKKTKKKLVGTKNERAKKVFDLLANEEVGHLKAFFGHYKGKEFGDIESFMKTPPDANNSTYKALLKVIGESTAEQQALEIAMKERRFDIDYFSD